MKTMFSNHFILYFYSYLFIYLNFYFYFYLGPKIGEVLNGQYQVLGIFGKGVFSNVVKAIELGQKDRKEFAIKILRNNDAM